MTTQSEIGSWFDRGLADSKKPTHMIVVVDTYDHEDYPVFVYPDQNVADVFEEYNGKNMQRVMEVYKLSMSKEAQLNQNRVFNF